MGDETWEPRDPNHIWLRQSVTFSVNGQTRTVEMALPLRPGATPGEVEALLDEADAGMRRLSRRLDAHLAELLAPPASGGAPVERPSAPPPERAAAAASAAPEAALPPTPPQPAPSAALALTPPPARPQERAAIRPSAAPQPAAPAPAGPDLTIPQFIAEAAAIGFDSRQAMEKLGVRSLSGLNLREALESLRRKALLDGASPAPTNPTPRPPAGPPLAFEEEDDHDAFVGEPEMELSYPDLADLPDDDAEDEEDFIAEESEPASPPPAVSPATPAPAADLGALRRDARLTSAAKLPPPAPRRASPPRDSGIAETPAPPLTPEPEETPGSRAERMLAGLRATSGGGVVSDHQRTAFANIVVTELKEKGVAALTAAIWNITPDQLGPDQFDALTNWGKRDHFKDEAREVLIAARAAPQPAAPPEEPAAQEPPAPPARGGRSTARTRQASQTEEPRGSR